MNENATLGKLVGITLTITIAIIMIASLVVPVISDATDHDKDYFNSGVTVSRLDDEAVTLHFENSVYTVNGVTVNPLNAAYSMITADTFAFRSSGGTISFTDFYGSNSVANITSFDLVANNGALTGTINSIDIALDYEYIYYQSASGDYAMVNLDVGSKRVYVNSDDFVYCDAYNNSLPDKWCIVSGSIKDGFTALSRTGESYDVVATYTEVDGYKDLYAIEKLEVTTPYGVLTITHFVAPYVVTALENAFVGTDGVYLAIPVILIVSLLVGAVEIIRTKNE